MQLCLKQSCVHFLEYARRACVKRSCEIWMKSMEKSQATVSKSYASVGSVGSQLDDCRQPCHLLLSRWHQSPSARLRTTQHRYTSSCSFSWAYFDQLWSCFSGFSAFEGKQRGRAGQGHWNSASFYILITRNCSKCSRFFFTVACCTSAGRRDGSSTQKETL